MSSLIAQQTVAEGSTRQLRAIKDYIRRSWHTLTRSNHDVAESAADPKFSLSADQRPIVYVPAHEDLDKIASYLRAQMPATEFATIEVLSLPDNQTEIKQPGLLYLPFPYVVPGGRFNEMYGWDSYFIQAGLLTAGKNELARNMADNLIYEIENYGKILSANRTYYLTRSQPPCLTPIILAIYRRTEDKSWLQRNVPAIETYYKYWTTGPHLVQETGLSRYYDSGDGPAPEVVSHERDESGRTHYDRVRDYYRAHPITDYQLSDFYNFDTHELTELFYKADRAMRESGFDPSNRFGHFNAGVLSYNPLCLNSLLYLMEHQTAEIYQILGQQSVAGVWSRRAEQRRDLVNQLMWDEKDGLYYDYDFERGNVRRYPFVTTFYPLWLGIANNKQAERVAKNLSLFECPGGLQTSTTRSGSQWDAPFGWAPMQLIAIEGLRRYGYHALASRISLKFLSLVLKEFNEHNVIVEKYDVQRRESRIREGLKFGYTSNEVGFGWTNATFLQEYSRLSNEQRTRLTGT